MFGMLRVLRITCDYVLKFYPFLGDEELRGRECSKLCAWSMEFIRNLFYFFLSKFITVRGGILVGIKNNFFIFISQLKNLLKLSACGRLNITLIYFYYNI
jgi:hypothetical protein